MSTENKHNVKNSSTMCKTLTNSRQQPLSPTLPIPVPRTYRKPFPPRFLETVKMMPRMLFTRFEVSQKKNNKLFLCCIEGVERFKS